MRIEPLHDTLLALARSLADSVLAAAARSTPEELASTRLGRAARSAKSNVAFDAERGLLIEPELYVEKMVSLIRAVPGGVRARELRAMLGLGKRPFLRVADAALATKRIRREGFKAGIRYLLP